MSYVSVLGLSDTAASHDDNNDNNSSSHGASSSSPHVTNARMLEAIRKVQASNDDGDDAMWRHDGDTRVRPTTTTATTSTTSLPPRRAGRGAAAAAVRTTSAQRDDGKAARHVAHHTPRSHAQRDAMPTAAAQKRDLRDHREHVHDDATAVSSIGFVADANEANDKADDVTTTTASAAAAMHTPLAELVHARLRRALRDVLHITQLTRVQQLAWAAMADRDRDVLLRSETGSGKTLAYALPVLDQLLRSSDNNSNSNSKSSSSSSSDKRASLLLHRGVGTLVCVVCPTRELVVQVADTLSTLLRDAPFLTVGSVHGGDNRHKEKARLRKGVPVLVTTPGRLLDHLQTTSAFVVRQLQTLILDEADRLLDMGFEQTVRAIMQLLLQPSSSSRAHNDGGGGGRVAAPESLKRVLVSATITAGVERLSHFTLRGRVAHVGDSADTFRIPATLRQHCVTVPTKHRLAVLLSFLRAQLDAGARRVMVFVSTADATEFLYTLASRLRSPFRARRRHYAHDDDDDDDNGGGATTRGSGKRAKRLTERANRHLVDAGVDVVTFDDDDDEDDDDGDNDNGDKAATTLQRQQRDAFLDAHVFKLHGNMSQVDRAAVFHAFKHGDKHNNSSDDKGGNGKSAYRAVLFCTDVAARGLDMPAVEWIVHYDAPTDATCYIHRIGRTARIGHSGDSVLFLAPHEAGYAAYLTRFVHAQQQQQQDAQTQPQQRAGGGGAASASSPPPAMLAKPYSAYLFYLTKLDASANHLWAHSTATLERAICCTVMGSSNNGDSNSNNDASSDHDDLRRIALFAYQSYIRAYAGMPRELKQRFFAPAALHLGHVAHSFGIDRSPGEVQRQLQQYVREDRRLARDERAVLTTTTTRRGVERKRGAGDDDESARDEDGGGDDDDGEATATTQPPQHRQAPRRKQRRVELPHDDRYHSMLAQRQRKVTRDYAERRRAERAPTRPLHVTEFDA